MFASTPDRRSQRGQMIALFAITLTVIIMFVGLVVDGGNALVQRRGAQNASDFAALAGARVIAVKIGGDIVNGTDANVVDAITKSIAVNKGSVITFGSPDGPRYVNATGGNLTFVGNGTIPTTAVGVTVGSSRSWRPYFLGIVGMSNWTASAVATARGGYAAGDPEATCSRPASLRRSSIIVSRAAGPVSVDPDRSVLPAAPHSRLAQRPGRLRLAEVRLLGLRSRAGSSGQHGRLRQQQALPPGRDRARRPTATVAARRSAWPAAPTGSAACPATRRAPIARTTSTTTSS